MPHSKEQNLRPKKCVISVSQALLLLIKRKNDQSVESKRLKELYFLGASNQENREAIDKLLLDPALDGYTVSMTNNVINEDASRRYFETQLALHTLKHNLKFLDSKKLKNQIKDLYDFIAEDPVIKEFIEVTLSGKLTDYADNFDIEYADLINKLNNQHDYQSFSSHEKEKLILLAKSSYLFLSIVRMHPSLPLTEAYAHRVFEKSQRGRIEKNDQHTTTSQHFGLMKNYMPLARNDKAHAHQASTHLRPADAFSFDLHADWPRETFKHLVHPFACSISGTTVASLRVFKAMHEKNKFPWDTIHAFLNYYRCYFSLMLFHSGGHSFFEFSSPLFIPEVRTAFQFIPGYEMLSLETLMLTHNRVACDEAFKQTIEYNDRLLLRKKINTDITESTHTHVLKMITQVNQTVSQCGSKHKQGWLAEFQKELDAIVMDVRIETLDKDHTKERLNKALDTLENKNKNYYHQAYFFSSRRENNSSLGKQIEAARRLLSS